MQENIDNINEEEEIVDNQAQQDIIASGIEIDPEDIEEMGMLADRLSDNEEDISELKFEKE